MMKECYMGCGRDAKEIYKKYGKFYYLCPKCHDINNFILETDYNKK